jgi:hypothetical protein
MKHHALNPAPRHNNRSQQPPTATQQLTQFKPHLPQLPQFLCPLEEAELSVLSIIAFPNNMSYKQQPAIPGAWSHCICTSSYSEKVLLSGKQTFAAESNAHL